MKTRILLCWLSVLLGLSWAEIKLVYVVTDGSYATSEENKALTKLDGDMAQNLQIITNNTIRDNLRLSRLLKSVYKNADFEIEHTKYSVSKIAAIIFFEALQTNLTCEGFIKHCGEKWGKGIHGTYKFNEICKDHFEGKAFLKQFHDTAKEIKNQKQPKTKQPNKVLIGDREIFDDLVKVLKLSGAHLDEKTPSRSLMVELHNDNNKYTIKVAFYDGHKSANHQTVYLNPTKVLTIKQLRNLMHFSSIPNSCVDTGSGLPKKPESSTSDDSDVESLDSLKKDHLVGEPGEKQQSLPAPKTTVKATSTPTNPKAEITPNPTIPTLISKTSEKPTSAPTIPKAETPKPTILTPVLPNSKKPTSTPTIPKAETPNPPIPTPISTASEKPTSSTPTTTTTTTTVKPTSTTSTTTTVKPTSTTSTTTTVKPTSTTSITTTKKPASSSSPSATGKPTIVSTSRPEIFIQSITSNTTSSPARNMYYDGKPEHSAQTRAQDGKSENIMGHSKPLVSVPLGKNQVAKFQVIVTSKLSYGNAWGGRSNAWKHAASLFNVTFWTALAMLLART